MLLQSGRTHHCGELREAHLGASVILFGWVDTRRDHGGAIFIDLRDRYGTTQAVFRPDVAAEAHRLAGDLRSEYCVGVAGTVVGRGENTNPKIPTGMVEVQAESLEVFSRSLTPPFLIEDSSDTRESLRLEHRYLDLRRPSMQRNLELKSEAKRVAREVLNRRDFMDVETPFLVRHTPGGARNFLVPSRLNRHHFYALAESPQLYKQLLMVAGFDRYYQIVRCFRDEDLRGDRQPEFTQIDIEMSFVEEAEICRVTEELVTAILKETIGVSLAAPFPTLTYAEAMARYGSDKPDLRHDLHLCEVTDLVAECGFRVFAAAAQAGGIVKALRLPQAADTLSRRELDELPELVKPVGGKGVAYARIQEGGSWQAPFAKNLTPAIMQGINQRAGANPGDVLLFLADRANVVNNALALLREEMARRFDLIPTGKWAPVWIRDFPLLEVGEETGEWTSCHHPFTAPLDQDVELLESDRRGEVRARAYDLVLNGVEIAGGSIRIHQEDLQKRVFAALGISEAQAADLFSFLLRAFRYGPPPHGGIALGLDRLVMLLAGVDSLRDIIAFPKTQKGTCLMSEAPSSVEERQLGDLHIQLKP